MCPKCHIKLLASSSKGRSKHYAYYHCVSPCNTRYKAKDTELWFHEFLNGINLNKNAQNLLNKMITQRVKSQNKTQKIGPSHFKKLADIENRLHKIQDLFVDGNMDAEDYHKTKNRYKTILDKLKTKESQQNKQADILDIYKKGIKKLENIENLFVMSEINQKRKLIGSIFPEKFYFEKNEVRTADINPILLKIANVNKAYKENKKRDKSKKNDLSHLVLQIDLLSNQNIELFKA